MLGAPRDPASLRLWQDAADLNSPASQVNKLETDRMSIIRRKIKGRDKHSSRVSEENAVSLAASKTPGSEALGLLDNLSPNPALFECMYVCTYIHTHIHPIF